MSSDDVHPDEMPDELDAFLADLRSAATDTTPPVVGDALATLFREGTVPMAAPAPRRRIAVRATVAGVVAGLAFGGLGVAGALPGPVQRRVADAVDHVGVHLPDDRPATTTTSTVPPTTTSTTAVVPPATTPTTAPQPGQSGDDHGTADEDHGGGSGQSGDDQGKAGEDHSGGSGNSGKGKGDGTDDDSSGKGSSGRIPSDGAGVHVDNGSHSGQDDDGGHG